MKMEDSGNRAAALKKTTNATQIHMVVSGCKVKLNFPSKSESSAISDVKRMILGGAVKA